MRITQKRVDGAWVPSPAAEWTPEDARAYAALLTVFDAEPERVVMDGDMPVVTDGDRRVLEID